MSDDYEVFGDNRSALESALEALAIQPHHAPIVALCRDLASWVDDPRFNDKAVREYRLALGLLMEATAGGDTDDFGKWIEELRSPVGDPENT